MAKITENLLSIKSLHQKYDQYWDYGNNASYERQYEKRDREARDVHDIEHGLSEKELRILFKILSRHYQDCGRKRGAILRYIKHYKEIEDEKKPKLSLFNLHRELLNKAKSTAF
jgi:hypothetical protein